MSKEFGTGYSLTNNFDDEFALDAYQKMLSEEANQKSEELAELKSKLLNEKTHQFGEIRNNIVDNITDLFALVNESEEDIDFKEEIEAITEAVNSMLSKTVDVIK